MRKTEKRALFIHSLKVLIKLSTIPFHHIQVFKKLDMKSMSDFFSSGIPKDQEPTFILFEDGINLVVIHKLSQPFLEVLTLDPTDNSLLSDGTDIKCGVLDNGEHNCTTRVNLPGGLRAVNFMAVSVTADGNADNSDTYELESKHSWYSQMKV